MTGILLALAYAVLFSLWIHRSHLFRVDGLRRGEVMLLFFLKLGAGTALWYIYTYIYPSRADADVYKYFDDSAVMFNALREKPLDYLRMMTGVRNDSPYFNTEYYGHMNNWYRQFESSVYNDAHTVIHFNAFVRLFSFGHFHVHTVFASLLSLGGGLALFKAFNRHVGGHARWFAAGVFLWPSMLLWTSGPMKECLLMTGMGLFLWGGMRVMEGHREWWRWVVMLGGLALMVQVKSYVLISLLPPLGALLWCRLSPGKAGIRFLAVASTAACLVLASGHLFPAYDVLELLAVKQKDFIGMATAAGSGSMVDLPRLEPIAASFLRNAPHALYMTFLSPFAMWDKGTLGLLGALENLLIPGLVLLAWRYRRPWREVDLPLFLFCLLTVLFLALIMGWTTPVVGALVRYRVPLLPLIALAALLVVRPRSETRPA